MTSDWAKRTVLVSGGSGFVGANMTARLIALGSNVICLERDRPSPNSLDALGIRDRATIVTGSIDNIDLIERILNEYQPDTVFHLAAQAIVGTANSSPLSTFESNIRGTYVLLEACRRSEKTPTVVVASSDKAYGDQDILPYTEDLPLGGVFPYDVSKTCTDLISISFAKTYDLPIAVVRSANIYGPADLNLSRIIPGTIVSVLANQRPIIRSDGTPIREFIHVNDVIDGYLTIAENIAACKGEAFNFGTNEPVQIGELVSKMIALIGPDGNCTPEVLLSSKIAREIDAQYLSGEKMLNVLKWKPSISLDEGLAETIEWYRSHITSVV